MNNKDQFNEIEELKKRIQILEDENEKLTEDVIAYKKLVIEKDVYANRSVAEKGKSFIKRIIGRV